MIPEIKISDFDYALPDDRIAKYPLPQRDMSKLLRYSDGEVSEHAFKDIADFIPENSIMVFNDTKVVPARLHFQRETGAHIEIFCLEPVMPAEYNLIFSETSVCRWKVLKLWVRKRTDNRNGDEKIILFRPPEPVQKCEKPRSEKRIPAADEEVADDSPHFRILMQLQKIHR